MIRSAPTTNQAVPSTSALSDPRFQRVLLHVDPSDEELHNPRLFGGNTSFQTVANSASRTVTSGSVISSSPSCFAFA